ncbi:FkbM family methyltransferase [Hyphomonas sp.]|uniref:FkbM family methyltransferase n=1 Tax=Hyphomonas sp. TaxID=87 RepID=UPI0030013D00
MQDDSKSSGNTPLSPANAPESNPSEPDMTPAEAAEYDAIVAELPVRGDIFLPTARMAPQDRLSGVKKIKALYEGDLDLIHRPRLEALAARYAGRKRCFIIGNGPSLSRTDLEKLKDEVTFATNGFFLKAADLSWTPTFYVVEDHLVAEDRAEDIHKLASWTKLFPANLAYVLEPDENTTFFDHRPRPSFPHGFDFSFEADKQTYAGGTVVYTCMQLAAYFGFTEIYLVGVDADYKIPDDVTVSGDGRVKELDMESDDTNHFHPDYFGKGKRWHQPNVDVMLGAYEEARKQCSARGVVISNATLGGKLDVFPRVAYASVFEDARHYPKLLVIDPTLMGDGSATGELKSELMKRWPAHNLMQIFDVDHQQIGVATFPGKSTSSWNARKDAGKILDAAKAFDPDVILYRPVPDNLALHESAMHLIAKLERPTALWIVDDWHRVIADSDNPALKTFTDDVQDLLKRSSARLSISEAMSKAFEDRYGVAFTDVANGVSPDEWPAAVERNASAPVRIRYAGSLADNMSLSTVRKIADSVERLADEGVDITFEIKTRSVWHERAGMHFEALKQTTLLLPDPEIEAYRAWLAGADIVVIAYNFDEESKAYIRYSQANKLPECLASGAPLLAMGPDDVATISRLKTLNCAKVVSEDNFESALAAVRELAGSPAESFRLAKAAQKVAFEQFALKDCQDKFASCLRAISGIERTGDLARSMHAHVDETAVVAELLSARKGAGQTMLDVGAHFGSSAAYFNALGWTIFCFEPDAENRQKLLKRFQDTPNITIDPRAVSEAPAKGVSFFTSPESTGISALHAFHTSHEISDTVDVTTVGEIAATNALSRVDFLKIDVEGFDFAVLKGVPWGQLQIDVIECEFEDSKTVKMGHTWKDIAAFLSEKGYAVYLSEWHPIVRYGISHDWRRVGRYPEVNVAPDAWGNILAFREDPGLEAVSAAFKKLLDYRGKKSDASSPVKNATATLAGQAGSGSRVRGALQFGRYLGRYIWARRLWTIPAALILCALFAVSFHPSVAPFRDTLWVMLSASVLGLATLYVASRSHAQATALRMEVEVLKKDTARLRDQLASLRLLFTKSKTAPASTAEPLLPSSKVTVDQDRITRLEKLLRQQTELVASLNERVQKLGND